MGARILCADLTELLKKTLVSCCEVNIQFEGQLEILGSIHIRADDEEVLNILLKEVVPNSCTKISQTKRKPDCVAEGAFANGASVYKQIRYCNKNDKNVRTLDTDSDSQNTDNRRGLFPKSANKSKKSYDAQEVWSEQSGEEYAGDEESQEVCMYDNEDADCEQACQDEAVGSACCDEQDYEEQGYDDDINYCGEYPESDELMEDSASSVDIPQDEGSDGLSSRHSHSPPESAAGTKSDYSHIEADNYWGLHKNAKSNPQDKSGDKSKSNQATRGTPTSQSPTSHPRSSGKSGGARVDSRMAQGNNLYKGAKGSCPGYAPHPASGAAVQMSPAPMSFQTSRMSSTVVSSSGVVEQKTMVINEQVTLINPTMASNHPMQNRQGSCGICGRKFTSEECLRIHLQNDHVGVLPCNVCGRKFTSGECLQIHLRQDHGRAGGGIEGSTFYKCSMCTMRFNSIEDLQGHMSRLHPGAQSKTGAAKNSLKCTFCNLKMPNADSLHRHMSTKHSHQRVYDCFVCGMRFYSLQTLFAHKDTHPK